LRRRATKPTLLTFAPVQSPSLVADPDERGRQDVDAVHLQSVPPPIGVAWMIPAKPSSFETNPARAVPVLG
jgi:hypothetical protein